MHQEMSIKTIAFSLPVACLVLATGATAQIPDIVMAETTQDQIVLFQDLDDSGYFDADIEVVALYNDGMGGTNFSSPRDVMVRKEGGAPVAYWVDTGQDQLFRGEDLDANGVIDLGEETFFYTYGASSPDGLALTDDGAVWHCSDGDTNQGIWRSYDADGNKTANDPGETVLLIDGTVNHTIEQSIGAPVSAFMGDILRMTDVGNGIVAFTSYTDSAHFRFEDKNGDDDVADAGESILFLNATGENPSFDWNPDFAGAVLGSDPRSLVVDPVAVTNGWLSRVASQDEGGAEIVYLGCDSSSTSAYSQNQYGEYINGLIFRCEDLNLDGDANDAGEVTTFYDGSELSGLGVEVLEKIIGIHCFGGEIFVCELNANSTPQFHRFRDLNGDNDAMDTGEQTLLLWDASSLFPAGVFFNGGAFVYEIGANEHLAWDTGPTCPPPVVYCTAKMNSLGCTPAIGYTGSPSLTDPNPFDINAVNIINSKPGILFYGYSPAAIPFQGGFLCVQPPIKRTPPQSSGGNPPPPDCSGTYHYDMNARIQSGVDPALQVLGVKVYAQYWSRDPQDPHTTNLSDALEFEICP